MAWKAWLVSAVSCVLLSWVGAGLAADAGVCVPLLPGVLQHVKPSEVHVGGEIGRRIELTIKRNVLALDYDRDFLEPFQNRLEFPATKEKRELYRKSGRQQFIGTGETLDAIVYLAAYTQDSEVIQLKGRLVESLLATQDSDGYIGQFVREPNSNPLYFDFTWEDASFIALALAHDYQYFGNEASRQAARSLVECLIEGYRQNPSKVQGFSAISYCDALLAVYQFTGEQRFFAAFKDTKLGPIRSNKVASLCDWDDVLFQRGWHDARSGARKDVVPADLPGRQICHVYRYLDRMYTQLKLHRLEPNDNYVHMSRKFYKALVRSEKPGMTIVGGMGRHEGWSEDQCGADGHSETCAASYSLWFFEELANLDDDLRYGDLMERVIYNALFAAQAPEGRQLRYFTPFTGQRPYYHTDIFCCPGNFRRGISRLPLNVYYRFKDGIAVNLYTPSDAKIDLGDGLSVRISQVTNYPTDGQVKLTVSPSKSAVFPVYLRLPRWCSQPEVKINGDSALGKAEAAVITRQWKDGDKIEMSLPMPWRFIKGRELQAERAAVMRGPVVYCLSGELNKLPADMPLRDIVIDPNTLGEPLEDSRTRPNGVSCTVAAWSPGRDVSQSPDLKLILSEFPEPTGEAIYFRLSDPAVAVDDELIE